MKVRSHVFQPRKVTINNVVPRPAFTQVFLKTNSVCTQVLELFIYFGSYMNVFPFASFLLFIVVAPRSGRFMN
jgi:hypothetical protein